MKTLPLLLSALLLATALPAAAQQMNYQGRLTDASGNALADGQYTLEFSLWDAATAGTQIWGPYVLDGTAGNGRGPKADLVNGRFNTVLGAVDTANRPLVQAFSIDVSGNTSRFLQIKVGTNSPISPRQAILAAPTALMAHRANEAERIANVWVSGTNVGIGTNTPKQTLHVNGDLYAKGHVWLHAYEGDGVSGTAYLQARDDSGTTNIGLELRTQSRTVIPAVRFAPAGTGTFFQRATFDSGALINGGAIVNGGANCSGRVRVSQAFGSDDPWIFDTHMGSNGINSFGVGTVGIELSYGNAWKPGGGSWANYSDARLKKDVRTLTGALDKLGELRAVTFDYKEPARFGVAGRQTGFIAQEVEKVFPEWIIESPLPGKSGDKADNTKYKSISISGFESLTVQALRELRDEKDAQIKTLTSENTTLHDTVRAQEARLAKLEQAVATLADKAGKIDKPAKATAQR